MKKKHKAKSKDEEMPLNEPIVSYSAKNRIRFYNSFEEQANDNYQHLASLKPEQHFENAKNLIERVYSKQLKNKTRSRRIIFN